MELVNLATEYRPQTFAEVVGQPLAVAALKKIAAADGIACRSVFLKGPWGCGKSTLCRIFARAMSCEHFKETGDVCNECVGCKEVSRKNSQLYYEFDSSVVGSIDAVRSMSSLFEMAPAGRRVIVFDECHMVSSAALNALLKVLEEGVPNTIFIFASTEDILPTIKSRSVCIDVEPVSNQEIKQRTKFVADSRGLAITDSELDLLAIKAQGHMRDALSILQYYEMCGPDALKTSFSDIRLMILNALSHHRDKAEENLKSVLTYNIVDIKKSLYVFLKSLFTAQQGTPEYQLLKKNIAMSLFNYFFSPNATMALKEELGVEILFRAFLEKACPE